MARHLHVWQPHYLSSSLNFLSPSPFKSVTSGLTKPPDATSFTSRVRYIGDMSLGKLRREGTSSQAGRAVPPQGDTVTQACRSQEPVCTSSPPHAAKHTIHPAVLTPPWPRWQHRGPPSAHDSHLNCSHVGSRARALQRVPASPLPVLCTAESTGQDRSLKSHSRHYFVAYGNRKLYAWGDGIDSKEKTFLLYLCGFPGACELEELLHQQKQSLRLAVQISLF